MDKSAKKEGKPASKGAEGAADKEKNEQDEKEVREWLGKLFSDKRFTETEPRSSLQSLLADGVLICQLANKIKKGTIPRINPANSLRFMHSENIRNYCQACKSFGVPPAALFQPQQLSQGTGIPIVVHNLLCMRELLETGAMKESIKRFGGKAAPHSSPSSVQINPSSSMKRAESHPSFVVREPPKTTKKKTQQSEKAEPQPSQPTLAHSQSHQVFVPRAEVTTIDQDMKLKEELKYNTALEGAVKEWIRAVMEDPSLFTEKGVPFLAVLKSGVILCELINKLAPGTIPKIVRKTLVYAQMDNITSFRWACEKLGLPPTVVFSTSDLFEGRNGGRVLDTLQTLARHAFSNNLTTIRINEVEESNSLYMQALTGSDFKNVTDEEAAKEACAPEHKALLDWANDKLAAAPQPVVLHNFSSDVKSGLKLLTLAECLLQEPCLGPRCDPPTQLAECMQNACLLFTFLEQRKMEQITCCQAQDIVTGNVEHVVDLVSYMRDEYDLEYIFKRIVEGEQAAMDAATPASEEKPAAEEKKKTPEQPVVEKKPAADEKKTPEKPVVEEKKAVEEPVVEQKATKEEKPEPAAVEKKEPAEEPKPEVKEQAEGGTVTEEEGKKKKKKKKRDKKKKKEKKGEGEGEDGGERKHKHKHKHHHKEKVVAVEPATEQKTEPTTEPPPKPSGEPTTLASMAKEEKPAPAPEAEKKPIIASSSKSSLLFSLGGSLRGASNMISDSSTRASGSSSSLVEKPEPKVEEKKPEEKKPEEQPKEESAPAPAPAPAPKPPQTGEALVKAQIRMRQRIAHEILTTEESYTTSLETMCTKVIQPLIELSKQWSGDPNEPTRPLSESEINALFSNASELWEDHKVFLQKVKERLDSWSDDTTTLGDLFLEQLPILRHYGRYLADYAAASAALHYMTQNNLPTKTLIERFEMEQFKVNRLNVPSFHVMPVQRLPRYVLLTNDLKKYTPANHPDVAFLTELQPKLQETVSELNKGIDPQKEVNMAKNIEIAESIAGEGVDEIVRGERTFIMEGPLKAVCPISVKTGKEKSSRKGHCFLFNNLIVLCELSTKKEKPYTLMRAIEAKSIVNILCRTRMMSFRLTYRADGSSTSDATSQPGSRSASPSPSTAAQPAPEQKLTRSASTSMDPSKSNESIRGTLFALSSICNQASAAQLLISSKVSMPTANTDDSHKVKKTQKSITIKVSTPEECESWQSELSKIAKQSRQSSAEVFSTITASDSMSDLLMDPSSSPSPSSSPVPPDS